MATQDDFQQRSGDFMDWLRQQEGVTISSKIALVDLRSEGRGRAVVATEDIEDDEKLFEIPRYLIMDIKSSDLRKHIRSDLDSLEPWQQTVLVMIYESGKENTSRWFPYWQVLPECVDHLLINWSHKELEELRGSSVLNRIGKEETDRAFAERMLPIVTKHPDLFGIYADGFKGSDVQATLLELAHRMAGVMMAYAFDVEEDSFLLSDSDSGDSLEEVQDEDEVKIIKGMVPLADMLNASGPEHNASISYGERELMMSSNGPIKAGGEILITFGGLPRSDLLRRYGYIDKAHIPYDVVELSFSNIREIVAATFHFTEQEMNLRTQGDRFGIRRKIERLIESVHSEEGDYQGSIFEEAYDVAAKPSRSGFFPLPLVCTIWLLVAEDAEVEALKATRPLKPRMNLKVAWVLRAVLANRQKDYPTSIDEDEKMLEQTDLPVRLRLAVEVRLGEKMILHAALEYFRLMDQKLPGGLDNWLDNSVTTTFLEGEEVVFEKTAGIENEAK